jgi:hypothetical protein
MIRSSLVWGVIARFVIARFFLVTVLVGCGGSADAGGPDSSGQSTATPICARTLCDQEFSVCKNPASTCDRCWKTCETIDVSLFASCVGTCNRICSDPPTQSPCARALDACRLDKKNAICVDHIESPPGSAPCNAEVQKALSICGDDLACFRALDEAIPACGNCSRDAWSACEIAVCPEEHTPNVCSAKRNAEFYACVDERSQRDCWGQAPAP